MTEYMLTDHLKDGTWTPAEVQSASFTRGGAAQVIEMGQPYWLLTASYQNLTDEKFRALSAWLARRRGGLVTFLAYRPGRKHPINRPDLTDNVGADPVNYSSVEKSLQIPAENIKPGDMYGYTDTLGRRYIGEVIEIVSTSPGFTRVKLFPPAPTPHASTPQGEWAFAAGRFQLDPGSVNSSEPYDGRRNLSFTARQVLA